MYHITKLKYLDEQTKLQKCFVSYNIGIESSNEQVLVEFLKFSGLDFNIAEHMNI